VNPTLLRVLAADLVDSSGNASLQLHLKELPVRRVLLQDTLQRLDLVLHANDGHLQGIEIKLVEGKTYWYSWPYVNFLSIV